MGKRPSAIVLTDEQREYLEGQTRIRTLQEHEFYCYEQRLYQSMQSQRK